MFKDDGEAATTLVRVYRETVQRVPCTESSIVAGASFIVVAPTRNVVLVYHGRGSSPEDMEVANEIAKEFKAEERRPKTSGAQTPPPAAEVLSITEDSDDTAGDILQVFLDIFWLTREDYRLRSKVVSQSISKNSPKILYVIERSDASSKYRLRKIAASLPDKRGCVPLLPFPIYHPKKLGVLIVGDQFDLFVGESCSRESQQTATQLVLNLINSAAVLGEGVTKRETGLYAGVHYDAPMRVQVQGFEDPAFRCHFEQEVKFTKQAERNPNVVIRDKSNSSELQCETSCTDVFSWIGLFGGGKGTSGGNGRKSTVTEDSDADPEASQRKLVQSYTEIEKAAAAKSKARP